MRRRTRKTVEREPVHDNKTSRRRFHRVYRPRTSPIFSPASEENPIQRVLLYFYPTYVTSLCILYARTRLYTRRHAHKHSYVYVVRRTRVCLNVSAKRIYIYTMLCTYGALYACVWTCAQYNAFTYILYHVYVCVARRISGHLITPEERKSKPPRDPHRGALRSEGSSLLSFSPGTMNRPSAIRLFGYIFSHKRGSGEGCARARKKGGVRVKPSQSIANWLTLSAHLPD